MEINHENAMKLWKERFGKGVNEAKDRKVRLMLKNRLWRLPARNLAGIFIISNPREAVAIIPKKIWKLFT
jgi:hypothetical protein